MKNRLIAIMNALFLILTGLNEGNIIDIMPIEDPTTVKWVKWAVAVLVLVINAFFFEPKKGLRSISNKRPSVVDNADNVNINRE